MRIRLPRRSVVARLLLPVVLTSTMAKADFDAAWITPPVTRADIVDLDVVSPRGIAIASDRTLLATDDLGGTWTVLAQLRTGGPEEGRVGAGDLELPPLSAVAVLSSGTYLVSGTDGTYRSVDDGASWDGVPTASGYAGDITEVTPGLIALVGESGLHVSLDDGLTWSQRSDPGFLWDQHWLDATTVLVASDLILRSTDAGVTWDVVGSHSATAVSMAADGLHGVAAGTTAMLTTDGGLTWSEVDGVPYEVAAPPTAVALDDGTAIVGVRGNVGSTGSLYRIADDGAGTVATCILDRIAPPIRLRRAPDGAIVGGGAVGALLRSTDDGATWTDLGSPFADATRPSIAGIRLTAGRGYAWSPYSPALVNDAPRLLLSGDEGVSWMAAPPPLPTLEGLTAQGAIAFAHGDASLARSDDGGQSWTSVDAAPVPLAKLELPVTGSTLFGFGDDDLVYRKDVDGGPWEAAATAGLPAFDFGLKVVDFLDDTHVFIAGRPDGVHDEVEVYASTDAGESFGLVGSITAPSPFGITVPARMAWSSPAVGLIGFGEVSDQGFTATGTYRTGDGGATWEVVGPGCADLDVDDGGRFHALVHPKFGDDALRSEDGGVTWEAIPHDLRIWTYFLLEPYAWGPTAIGGGVNHLVVGSGLGELQRFDRTTVAVPAGGIATDGLDLVAHHRVGERFALTAHLPLAGEVAAEVVDVQGRLITRLVDRWHEAGVLSLDWDGRLGPGQPAAPGVYFVVLRAGGQVTAERVLVVR